MTPVIVFTGIYALAGLALLATIAHTQYVSRTRVALASTGVICGSLLIGLLLGT